ncbi:MAG: glycerophosphodiester phosphodiesterase [Polyangiaceae bacterium]
MTVFRRRAPHEAPLVVGHRGGRGPDLPVENTLPAFERARADGAVAVELDVRTTRDGRVVVFHDRTLRRLRAGDDRTVDSMDADTLLRTPLDGDVTVPTLDDVLAWAKERDVSVNVEMKRDVPSRGDVVRGVLRSLRRTGSSESVIVSSFDPWMLVHLGAVAPNVRRALLTHARGSASPALRAVARRPWVHAIHVERSEVTAARVDAWHARSLVVATWTIAGVDDARIAADAGVDVLVTDRPGRLLGTFVPGYPSAGANVIRTRPVRA